MQTSKMELLAKIVNNLKTWTILQKTLREMSDFWIQLCELFLATFENSIVNITYSIQSISHKIVTQYFSLRVGTERKISNQSRCTPIKKNGTNINTDIHQNLQNWYEKIKTAWGSHFQYQQYNAWSPKNSQTHVKNLATTLTLYFAMS